jgi:AraC-like DNA-binding protein
MLFKLAGALLAFQKTTGTIVKDSELRLIHRKWHTRAKPYLNPDQDESEYFTEFLDAWANVVYPLSESELEIAWRRAQTAPTPPEALTAELTSPNLCRLVALCRELQLLNGSEAFYLSPYSVMRLFKQNTHTQACSWISGLCRMGILTLVKPGAPRVRAATYRFNFANLP